VPPVRVALKGVSPMNLTVSGHHVSVTPAIHDYVVNKLARVNRHFDHVIDVAVILSVEKQAQKAEVNLHVRGRDISAHSADENMYAAIDLVADKLDRQILKHKDKTNGHSLDWAKREAKRTLN
jgi:putative sigma-54 modulation protein